MRFKKQPERTANMTSFIALLIGCSWSKQRIMRTTKLSAKGVEFWMTKAFKKYGTEAGIVKHALRFL